MAKLIDPTFTGAIDQAAFKQSVATLLANKGGDNPAITKEPADGAFTTEITDAAAK